LGVVESLADSELQLVQNWDYVLQKEVQIFSLVISSKLRSCYRLKVQSCIAFFTIRKEIKCQFRQQLCAPAETVAAEVTVRHSTLILLSVIGHWTT
jgi:hypothetical protein